MTKAKRQSPLISLARAARNNPGAALQLAAIKYLKAKGWNVILIGEIEIQTWDAGDAAKGKHKLAVGFQGIGAQSSRRKRRIGEGSIRPTPKP